MKVAGLQVQGLPFGARDLLPQRISTTIKTAGDFEARRCRGLRDEIDDGREIRQWFTAPV